MSSPWTLLAGPVLGGLAGGALGYFGTKDRNDLKKIMNEMNKDKAKWGYRIGVTPGELQGMDDPWLQAFSGAIGGAQGGAKFASDMGIGKPSSAPEFSEIRGLPEKLEDIPSLSSGPTLLGRKQSSGPSLKAIGSLSVPSVDEITQKAEQEQKLNLIDRALRQALTTEQV